MSEFPGSVKRRHKGVRPSVSGKPVLMASSRHFRVDSVLFWCPGLVSTLFGSWPENDRIPALGGTPVETNLLIGVADAGFRE